MSGSIPRPGSPYRPKQERPSHIPGRVIVRFKDSSVRAPAMALQAREISASTATGRLADVVRAPFQYLVDNAGLSDVRALFPDAEGLRASARRGPMALMESVSNAPVPKLSGIVIADIDPKRAQHAIKALKASSAVEFAELAPTRWLLARANAKQRADNVQWSLKAIGWFDANRPDASKTYVGVLDTGVDRNHPALRGRVAAYRTNGFSTKDLIGHGTHVCGIIAAKDNPKVGMRGITDAKLKVWKIFPDTPDSDGDFYVDVEVYLRSLGEAISANVGVINLSIGGSASSKAEAVLFQQLRAADVVAIAAMGNEFQDGNPVEYPAAYKGVSGIGAVDVNLRRARFSNTGRHIAVMAPGVGIISTVPTAKSPFRDETDYATWDGTSMASPHVAAAVNLLLAKFPGLPAATAVSRLKSSARKLSGMGGKSYTREYGFGLVNLVKLLK